MKSPANRTAFVTGAWGSHGYAVACSLAHDGVDLVVSSRKLHRLQASGLHYELTSLCFLGDEQRGQIARVSPAHR